MSYFRKIGTFFSSLWHDVSTESNMKKEVVGELFVTASGEVTIELQFHPDDVDIMFKDESVETPCHHKHHHDKIEWSIQKRFHHEHDHVVLLVIRWHVSGARTLVWRVRD